MARHMLYSGEMNRVIKNHFSQKEQWQEKTITVTINPEVEFEVSYFYNLEKNAVVMSTPLAVKPVTASDFFEPPYEETVATISRELGNMNFSVSASLIGKGIGERHYAAFHKDREGKMVLFDSHISDPERFLNSADKSNLLETVWYYFTSLFRVIQFKLGFGRITHSLILEQDIEVYRLGTQSALDGVSCGYHSSGAVIAISEDIEKNDSSSLESIKNVIEDNKQLDLIAEALLNQTPKTRIKIAEISPALSTFTKATPRVTQSTASTKVSPANVTLHVPLPAVKENQAAPPSTAERPSM
ncbi:hypothetical protein [Legionella maioricensis]|uniref:Uncharacterized protein n=1 Tax=Legionella maioricensis TaxID=2896528 RepID=A0A9X2D035_9GAMM|nr:hypothetical protein [Legionella maioricensis]MCL9683849.1 hypothetical protein [Legionella maioricensis]MCL9686696.1 hypothetical protein [Legionella maioricensis]